MLTSEVLKKAQRAIVEHGWVKDNFGNTEIGFCMVGAVAYAMNAIPVDAIASPAYNTISDQLYKENEDAFHGLTDFNDRIAKDKKDVVEAFNRAIALAKMRERQ